MPPATPPLPPDRSWVLSEQRNPRTSDLHDLSVAECVRVINQEDRGILDALDKARPALTALIEAAEPGFLRGGRLIYLGAGTSGRLGVLDASEAPPTFQVPPGRVVGIIAGGDSALRKSSEGMEDDPRGAVAELDALRLTPDDTVIGIAAGGTTPYVLGALEYVASNSPSLREGVGGWANRQLLPMRANTVSLPPPGPLPEGGGGRPLTALLTCSPIPTPRGVDHLVVLETGPEVITGSTRMKAGTATKLALNTISTTLMIRSGRVYQNLMVDLRATNAKLRDRAARIISTLTGLPRGGAFELLDRAGGEVKAAIVMHHRNVDADEARRLLAAAGGRLGGVIPPAPHAGA